MGQLAEVLSSSQRTPPICLPPWSPIVLNALLEMNQAVKIFFTFTWGRVEFASLQPEPQEVSGAGHVSVL